MAFQPDYYPLRRKHIDSEDVARELFPTCSARSSVYGRLAESVLCDRRLRPASGGEGSGQ